MATKTIHICDRCKAEKASGIVLTLVKVMNPVGGLNARDIELCRECLLDYWTFTRNEVVVARDYSSGSADR